MHGHPRHRRRVVVGAVGNDQRRFHRDGHRYLPLGEERGVEDTQNGGATGLELATEREPQRQQRRQHHGPGEPHPRELGVFAGRQDQPQGGVALHLPVGREVAVVAVHQRAHLTQA